MKRITVLLLALIMVLCSLPLSAIGTGAAFEGADKINIVLDPGHGGYNVGAAAGKIAEKNHTMKLAQLIRDKLIANGNFNVYLTRTGDYDLELYERAEVANSYNADILISLHFDGNASSGVHGTTAYTSVFDQYAAVTLAKSITSNISSAVGLTNNGVRRRADDEGYYWNTEKQWDCKDSSLGVLSDYYGIPTWCAKFGIPSIIVEHGFFSNPGDASIITAEGALEKIATAEANAIINYYANHVHVYSSAKRDFPSNCIYTGKQSEHCSVCAHRKNVTSLAPNTENHYWVTKESVTAACGRDGKVVRECRITQNLVDKGWNGSIHTTTEIIPAPTQHTFELTADVAPTHTVDGYQQWKCKTCSYSFKETEPAEGHTYEFLSYKEPTCTEAGGNTYKCTGCTSQYTDTEAAKGHSFTATDRTDPTCTEKGSQTSLCSVCNFEKVEEFAPLGHSLPENAKVDATCEEDGYARGTCLRCGEAINEVLEKTGHSLEVTSETPATCDSDGKNILTCSSCGYTEEKILPAKGHSYVSTVALEATCEKEGKESLYCSACGYTTEQTIAATGHTKNETATVTKEATLFSKGSCEYTCINGCGMVFTEELPAAISENARLIVLAAFAAFIAGILAVTVFVLIKKAKNAEDPEKEESVPAAETEEAAAEESQESEISENSEATTETEKQEAE